MRQMMNDPPGTAMNTGGEKREGRDAAAGFASPAVAPGPGLLLLALLVLVLPILLAFVLPHLPAAVGGYIPALPLPLLEIEAALVFALFALPAFRTPGAEEAGPALTGLVRGVVVAVLAVPFVFAARAVAPASVGAVLAGCALVAATGAGSAAAAAAFGARGIAAALSAAALPGLLGFFGAELDLPLGWLGALCPFTAAGTAVHGGASWTLGLLPGIALLAASAVLRSKPSRS